MSKNQSILHRKKLVIAVSLALVGGTMGGCSSSNNNDDSAGTSTIEANGGLGGSTRFNQGGNGGGLYMYNAGAGGGVELRQSGAASTSITSPETPTTANLGTNPLLVTSDTLIETPVLYSAIANAAGTLITGDLYVGVDSILRSSVAGGAADYTNDTIVADGSFYRSSVLPDELYQALGGDATPDLAPAGMGYFRDGNSNVYISDADDSVDDTIATGLSVAAGSTLSLASNEDCDTELRVNNDIDNSGVIQKELSEDCALDLRANSYFASGDVSNAGSADNEDGGSVYINGNSGITNSGNINVSGFDAVDADSNGGSAGSISMSSNGFIINSGQLLAAGGDGLGTGSGGSGGSVDVEDAQYTENSGAIDVSGGNNTAVGESASNGSSAGNVYMHANTVLNNTADATINGSGGNGTSGGGGAYIQLEQSNQDGALLNAGAINANGGTGSDNDGGDGGEIYINTNNGGQIQSSGELSSTGGSSDDDDAGNGGEVTFYTDYDDIGPGDIVVSGNINLDGGSSPFDGSNGGFLSMSNDVSGNTSGQRIALLGYSAFNGNGGDGYNGGDGSGASNDGIYIETDDNGNSSEGSIVNELALNARGGNSTATGTDSGNGGEGGDVDMRSTGNTDTKNIDVTVTNTASIDVSGGTGYNGGGDGGEFGPGGRGGEGGSIYLYGTHGADNAASLTANAGDGGEFGNNGGYVEVSTETGTAINKGALSANGSQGDYVGGQGGDVYMYGNDITNTAALSVNGGNGTDAVDAFGGDGGEISMFTTLFTNPANSGSFSYSFGTGVTENGVEGNATVNFSCEGNCEVLLTKAK